MDLQQASFTKPKPRTFLESSFSKLWAGSVRNSGAADKERGEGRTEEGEGRARRRQPTAPKARSCHMQANLEGPGQVVHVSSTQGHVYIQAAASTLVSPAPQYNPPEATA